MHIMEAKDNQVINLVRNYIDEHLDKSDPVPEYTVFIVWKCKTLQNWKYLLSSTIQDILDRLDSVPNRNAYIKRLIREDIERNSELNGF